MSDIQIFVACHQPEQQVPDHPLLKPIQVGAALVEEHFPGFLHDDTGDSISDKNRSYCELTAQYWAWKNVEADYYGFFHYRRYLYPDIYARRPYRIMDCPTSARLKQLGYANFTELISKCDLITPIGEQLYQPVREHYAAAQYHHRRDLELAAAIVGDLYPGYREAAERFLGGTVCYFGNIYIMRRPVFQDYCAWLFPILERFDLQVDRAGYTPQEQRVDGYLAERLFGIYYTAQSQRQALRMLELPRVHFVPAAGERLKKRLLNMALPPSSQRRAIIKHLFT